MNYFIRFRGNEIALRLCALLGISVQSSFAKRLRWASERKNSVQALELYAGSNPSNVSDAE